MILEAPYGMSEAIWAMLERSHKSSASKEAADCAYSKSQAPG